MPTSLEEPRTPGAPIVKGRAIGQTFVGALVDQKQRDKWKDGKPDVKDDGKVRQELVVTLIAMPGTTTPAGLAGNEAVPAPGDKVRMILSGALFHDWIEAKRDHPGLQTGDVVTWTLEYGQAFTGPGAPVGGKLTTQDEVNAVDTRTRSVGIYGTLTLRRPTSEEAKWATLADEAYHASKRAPVSLEADDEEEPF